jgi:hypothetical protein
MKQLIFFLFNLFFFTTISLSQIWTPIPFGSGAGSVGTFPICGGITGTVSDNFLFADSDGSVFLDENFNPSGEVSFSAPLGIRVENAYPDQSSDNNGDFWEISGRSS